MQVITECWVEFPVLYCRSFLVILPWLVKGIKSFNFMSWNLGRLFFFFWKKIKKSTCYSCFKINYCHCTCFLYEMIFFRWRKSFWEYYEKLGSYLLVFLSLYSEIPCWVWTFIAKCFTKDRWRMHLRFIAERDPKK